MDFNQKEKNKLINYINSNNSQEEKEYAYLIDSQNILKIEQSKNINEDLSKFFGQQNEIYEEDLVNKSTSSSTTNSLNNTIVENNSQKLMYIFIEKLFPKCNLEAFSISKRLCTQYFKKNNPDKTKLEESVNYIYKNKQNYLYSSIINFDLKTIQNLGYILMMSYFKFNDYKINDRKALKTNIKDTIKKSQDVMQDFFNYINKKKLNPEHHKKTIFWDKHSQDYYLPGIFIFLMNTLEKIETVNINFEMNIEEITNEDLDFFIIVIYNLQFLFTNVNKVKIDLIHKKLQCGIFSKYFRDYQKDLDRVNRDIKKQFINLDFIYDKKWDFQTDFLLYEYRNIYKNEYLAKKKQKNIEKLNKPQIGNLTLDLNETKNMKNVGRSRLSEFLHDIKLNFQQRFSIQPAETLFQKVLKNNEFPGEIEEEINEENEQYLNNNPDRVYNKIDINNDNLNVIKSLLLAINAINRFTNLCKIELIFNDSYTSLFYNFFENEIFDQENKVTNLPLLKDFHLLDIISNKFMKLNSMNLEMNSLDSIVFKKILEGINVNPSIISLYISFFSSDITYFQQSLYKIYNPKISLKKENLIEDIEFKILDKLLLNFTKNLQVLFNLIRIKRIQILGFCFDIPDIMENNQQYMIVIIKFILNILLYITKKDTIIQKVILLAPKIKMNNDFFPFINKTIGNINCNDNNKMIKELSLQMQLYKIINIKNIISESLILLNIGNCDISTFKELIKYLSSFRFCLGSSLSELSISLVKSLRILNKEIYGLLFILFNIKLKQLKELNLYTNIIIKHIKEYLYLLNIFNNNWISSCTLTLNPDSENIYKMEQCQNDKNKIKYFVPNCLENDLLSPEEMVLRKKINGEQNCKKNDDSFWYLKYMFRIRFSCLDINKNNKNESLSKFLTNNILSYIYFQKNIKINHKLEKKECNEKNY